MSVGGADLHFHSSANGSSAGGADTGVDYSNAKGGFFANVADVDRLAGGVENRKWFLFNDHPTDDLVSPSIWFETVPTYMTEQIGLGFDSSDDADVAQGNVTAIGTPAQIAVVSDGSDSRTATLWGIDDGGNPISEDVPLNGSTEVLSVATFSVLYATELSAIDAVRTVRVKEGSGGTVRGTIGPTKKCCWLWLSPQSKGAGIRLPNLAAQSSYGFWDRIEWDPAVSGVRPNASVVAVEEN